MTDYLQEAVEAFRKEVARQPGGPLLIGTMVRRGLRAVEPILEAHYREKLEAEMIGRGGRLVPIAGPVFDELDRKWSRPVEVAIADGELRFRAALQVDEETTRG